MPYPKEQWHRAVESFVMGHWQDDCWLLGCYFYIHLSMRADLLRASGLGWSAAHWSTSGSR